MSYVVEVERSGIRVLYGPIVTIQKARAVADKFLDTRTDDEEMVVLVRMLLEPPWVNPVSIHPNQTTIQDHIEDIHDHVG